MQKLNSKLASRNSIGLFTIISVTLLWLHWLANCCQIKYQVFWTASKIFKIPLASRSCAFLYNLRLQNVHFSLKCKLLWSTECVRFKLCFAYPETYSEPSRMSKLEPLSKIADCWKPSIIIAKSSILDAWLGSEYTTGIHVTSLDFSYVNMMQWI